MRLTISYYHWQTCWFLFAHTNRLTDLLAALRTFPFPALPVK